MLALQAHNYMYGVHCPLGQGWSPGPRAYGVGHLLAKYGAAAHVGNGSTGAGRGQGRLSKSFTFTRAQTAFSTPSVRGAAWHMSSVGSGEQIRTKLSSWLHAGMFAERSSKGVANKGGAAGLNASRLERCARYCLGNRRSDGSMPPCAGRDDRRSPKLGGRWVPTARGVAGLELPPPLLEKGARREYPSFWRYVER